MSYVPVFAITGFMWLCCSKLDNQTISLLWLSAPRAAAMFVSSLLTNSRRGWLMLYQYTSVTQARLVRTARHRFHTLKMQQCSWLNFHKISNVDFLHKLDPETNRKKKMLYSASALFTPLPSREPVVLLCLGSSVDPFCLSRCRTATTNQS